MTEREDDREQLAEQRLRAVGARVRSIRRARNVSQEQLCTMSGIDRSTLGDTERDGKNITLKTLYALADALGVHAAELLDERDH